MDAPDDQREKLMHRLDEELQSARDEVLSELLAFHPVADRLRLEKAQRLVKASRYSEAELVLQALLWKQGSGAGSASRDIEGQTTAVLAELYRRSGRLGDAATVLSELEREFGDVVCLDKKTGKQLADAARGDKTLGPWLGPHGPWPTGPFKVQSENVKEKVSSQSRVYLYPVHLTRICEDTSAPMSVFVDQTRLKVTAFGPDGGSLWTCQLNKVTNTSGRIHVHYGGIRGSQVGNLLFLWMASRIVAIDGWTGRVLWEKDVTWPSDWARNAPLQIRQLVFNMQRMQEPDRNWATHIAPFVVTPQYVAFQQGKNLIAVHPTSGEVLWQRDDAEAGCDLLGDSQVVVVGKPDGTQATAFSALDGRRLGTCKLPALDKRVARRDRRIVVWDQGQLSLVDPWSKETIWQHKFKSQLKPWPVSDGKIAALDDNRRLRIVAADTGDVLLETALDRLPEKIESFGVVGMSDCYVCVVNTTTDQQGVARSTNRPMIGTLRVNGRVVAIEADSGKVRWASDIKTQSLRRSYPSRLPMLTFFRRYQVSKKLANGTLQYGQVEGRFLCLDMRTGKAVYESVDKSIYDVNYALQADYTKRRIELSTSKRQVVIGQQ
jgi:outer membrane protein assembly factor BamB